MNQFVLCSHFSSFDPFFPRQTTVLHSKIRERMKGFKRVTVGCMMNVLEEVGERKKILKKSSVQCESRPFASLHKDAC